MKKLTYAILIATVCSSGCTLLKQDAVPVDEPWRDRIPAELRTEYIVPDRVIDEEADDWRPLFTKIFTPVVRGSRTPTEAVKKINDAIWDLLDVHYSTKRDKANQSPFHSMRIHMASCTGLTILQVCAYRSVGIPARLAGCNWTTIPGNHSWPEYWDDGWHFCSDGNLPAIDGGWFAPFAAEANAKDPSKRIYASRATPKGTWFWRTWGPPRGPSNVPAEDVTENYRRFKKQKLTNDDVPLDANYVHPSKRQHP